MLGTGSAQFWALNCQIVKDCQHDQYLCLVLVFAQQSYCQSTYSRQNIFGWLVQMPELSMVAIYIIPVSYLTSFLAYSLICLLVMKRVEN